jgi:hypothetical protein
MNRGCQSICKGDEEVFSGEWDPREINKVVDSVNHFWTLGNRAKESITRIIEL